VYSSLAAALTRQMAELILTAGASSEAGEQATLQ
jgi:hypothetical protein